LEEPSILSEVSDVDIRYFAELNRSRILPAMPDMWQLQP
jgi:hypothetical protein